MLIDVSHLGASGVEHVLQLATRPVIATHSCARALRDHHRNLTDEQIKGIAATGGVIFLNFYAGFKCPNATRRLIACSTTSSTSSPSPGRTTSRSDRTSCTRSSQNCCLAGASTSSGKGWTSWPRSPDLPAPRVCRTSPTRCWLVGSTNRRVPKILGENTISCSGRPSIECADPPSLQDRRASPVVVAAAPIVTPVTLPGQLEWIRRGSVDVVFATIASIETTETAITNIARWLRCASDSRLSDRVGTRACGSRRPCRPAICSVLSFTCRAATSFAARSSYSTSSRSLACGSCSRRTTIGQQQATDAANLTTPGSASSERAWSKPSKDRGRGGRVTRRRAHAVPRDRTQQQTGDCQPLQRSRAVRASEEPVGPGDPPDS